VIYGIARDGNAPRRRDRPSGLATGAVEGEVAAGAPKPRRHRLVAPGAAGRSWPINGW